MLELVGAKKVETMVGLLSTETFRVALKENKDILDDNSLQVDFFLVIKILRLQFNLNEWTSRQISGEISLKKQCACTPVTCQRWRLGEAHE